MGGLCKKSSGDTLYGTQIVPDSFKMDPPLANAEPVSDTGGISVITFFKKLNNHSTAAVREKSEKNTEKIALQTPMPAVKEGEEVLQMLEQRFFFRAWRRT